MADRNPQILETARLRLRPIRPSDASHLQALWSDPHVLHYYWDDIPPSAAFVRQAIRASRESFRMLGIGQWIVETRGCGAFLGEIGLVPPQHPLFDVDILAGEPGMAELIYALLPAGRGLGYATEGALAVLAWGLKVPGLDRIVAVVDAPNAPSQRVLSKVGLTIVDRRSIGGEQVLTYQRLRSPSRDAGRSDST